MADQENATHNIAIRRRLRAEPETSLTSQCNRNRPPDHTTQESAVGTREMDQEQKKQA